MKPLVIVGAGGHGRELLDIVEAINQVALTFDFVGFLDDTGGDSEILARRPRQVVGPTSDLSSIEAFYAIGIGAPDARRRFDQLATGAGREAATLIHPSATLGGDVVIGPGCAIAAGVRITNHVILGRHTHLNVNCTVSHDCRLGDYVTLSPGSHVSGWTTLREGVTLGTGAVTRDRIVVGEETLVGAGAVVVTDLPSHAVAMGVPARAVPADGKTSRQS